MQEITPNVFYEHKSDRLLVVVFASILNSVQEHLTLISSLPINEFFKSTSCMEASRLFLRDGGRCWFLRGINETIDDVPKTCAFIKSKIDKLGAKRVIFVGNSSGGYGAIHYGILMEPDAVIAFSPQTFISDQMRTHEYTTEPPVRVDLRELVKTKPVNTHFDIHMCDRCEFDWYHINGFEPKNLKIHTYDCDHHFAAQYMKKNGLLSDVFRRWND